MSKRNQNILEAYEKGYRIKDGKIISHLGNIIKPMDSGQGYPKFSIRNKEGICVHVPIHRFVAYQKYGDKIFEDKIEVRHKNDIKADFSDDNIILGSHRDNMLDVPQHIRRKRAIRASSFLKLYDNDQVKLYHSIAKSYTKTMKRFNISSKGTLHYILNN